MTKTLRFVYERETKNTYRYQEEPAGGQPPAVGTFYVQKWALGNRAARVIKVTIETVEGES